MISIFNKILGTAGVLSGDLSTRVPADGRTDEAGKCLHSKALYLIYIQGWIFAFIPLFFFNPLIKAKIKAKKGQNKGRKRQKLCRQDNFLKMAKIRIKLSKKCFA